MTDTGVNNTGEGPGTSVDNTATVIDLAEVATAIQTTEERVHARDPTNRSRLTGMTVGTTATDATTGCAACDAGRYADQTARTAADDDELPAAFVATDEL